MINLYLPLGVGLNLLMFWIMMDIGWKAWKVPYRKYVKSDHYFILVLLFVCVFSYIGDFYHYYNSFLAFGKAHSHIEEIYKNTYTFAFNNYYIWRLGVWGLSIFLLDRSVKKYHLNPLLYWFVFISYGLVFFANGRVSLAMAIMYFGLTFILCGNGNFKKIVGVVIILSSILFHKSAVFGVGAIGLSLICFRLNKYTITLVILLIPVMVVALSSVLSDFVLMDSSGESTDTITSAQGYLNRENNEYGVGRYIQKYLLWIDFILWAVFIIKTIIKGYYRKMPYPIRILTTLSFIILLISTIFFYDFGFGTRILQLRFAEFVFMPMAYVLAYGRELNMFPRLFKWIIYVSITQTTYALIYALYIAILNPLPS